MYVLSISSVSEVLMVQFAFSKLIQNSQRLSRPFISFIATYYSPPPLAPCHPSSLVRVPSRVYPAPPPSPLFFVHHVAFIESPIAEVFTDPSVIGSTVTPSKRDRSIDRTTDRVEIERARQPRNEIVLFESAPRPTMPLVSDCLFRDYPIRSADSTNIGIRETRTKEQYASRTYVINIRGRC